MAIKDNLGDRMKSFYEAKSQTYLLRRVPVILRVDGKSFHTFCKRFERPYDKYLNACLNSTLEFICGKIQGVKMGQRHSDEMSLLLTDFDNLKTDAFFEYNVQKMCSVVAAMATSEFIKKLINLKRIAWQQGNVLSETEDWPVFDCRCFNIPQLEISNYFWWRMLDAKRNSINMVSQSVFGHQKLQGKTCNQMQEMLFQEKQINWDKLPQGQKSGMLCLRETVSSMIVKGPNKGQAFQRSVWKTNPAPKTKSELDQVVSSLPLVSVPEI